MKRTNTVVWSVATVVLAVSITAGPAAATSGNGWLNKSSEPAATSQPTQSGPADYRSVNSIVGARAVPAETASVVHEGGGFSWGDAFIGAGAAFTVMLISAMAVFELRRHRRVTVASRA